MTRNKIIEIVTISRKDCQVTIQLSSIERVFPVGRLHPTRVESPISIVSQYTEIVNEQILINCFSKGTGRDLENLFRSWLDGKVVIVGM